MSEAYPQHEAMSSDAMVRNLELQAAAIWPQEQRLLDRYGQPAHILDAGCGSGEITARLAARYASARLLGMDVDARHLDRARARCREYGSRTQFRSGNIYALDAPGPPYDLVVCRSVLQTLTDPRAALQELARALGPGGWLHVLLEDYGMLHFWPQSERIETFWLEGRRAYAGALGIDLEIGRRGPSLAREIGLEDVRMDYVVVDSLRVGPALFAAVLGCWREAFSDDLVAHTRLSAAEVDRSWDAMIRAIHTGYAVWHVPVLSGRRGLDPGDAAA